MLRLNSTSMPAHLFLISLKSFLLVRLLRLLCRLRLPAPPRRLELRLRLPRHQDRPTFVSRWNRRLLSRIAFSSVLVSSCCLCSSSDSSARSRWAKDIQKLCTKIWLCLISLYTKINTISIFRLGPRPSYFYNECCCGVCNTNTRRKVGSLYFSVSDRTYVPSLWLYSRRLRSLTPGLACVVFVDFLLLPQMGSLLLNGGVL